jgi:hypothetical protein
MAVRHALTAFRRGLNLADPADGAGKIPVPMFAGSGQGWKVYYEDFVGMPSPTIVDLTDSSTGTASNTLADAGTALTVGEHNDHVASLAAKVNENLWQQTVESTGAAAVGIHGAQLAPKDATDNSSTLIHAPTANILMGANTKKFYFETAIKVDLESGGAIAQGELFVGYTSGGTGTSFINAGGTAFAWDDGFGFGAYDGDTTLTFFARQSDVEQAVSAGAGLVDGTVATLGVYYDGTNYEVYVDGDQKSKEARTVYNDDASVGISLYSKNGEAKAHDLTVHYMLLAVEL